MSNDEPGGTERLYRVNRNEDETWGDAVQRMLTDEARVELGEHGWTALDAWPINLNDTGPNMWLCTDKDDGDCWTRTSVRFPEEWPQEDRCQVVRYVVAGRSN
ncbi:hypothetical protein ABZ820_40990 [Streptomyces diacarni]|uniref:hypothetical protein n=1 Tax=Streptomyces diacarni TaxID=2800381 RepID=UPI0033D68AB7